MADVQIKCLNHYYDDVYILTDLNNELYKYNKSSEEFGYIGKINRGNSFYCTSVLVGDKIFYFSYYGTEFCIYDITNNIFKYKSIDLNYKGHSFGACSSAVVIDDDIYVFGGAESIPLSKINSKSLETECVCDWLEGNKDDKDILIKTSAYTNHCVINGEIWFPTNIQDVIISYNTNIGKSEVYVLPHKGIHYYTVNFDGKYFWLTGDRKDIFRWNKEKNELKSFENLLQGIDYNSNSHKSSGLFYTGLIKGQIINYIPLNSNAFICLNTESETIEVKRYIDPDEFCFWTFSLTKDEYLCQISKRIDANRYTLKVTEQGVEDYPFNLSGINYKNAITSQLQEGNFIISENGPGMLEWYLNAISNA